jgi:hypothetical protein
MPLGLQGPLPQGARIPITLTMDQLATETTALGAGLSDPTTWITAAVILFLLMCSGVLLGLRDGADRRLARASCATWPTGARPARKARTAR